MTSRILRRLARHQVAISLLLLLAWTEETAWRLRGDASYDLLNYHLYGPFALLHGKWGRDLAAAQSQGFLPPTIDIPYYLLARHVGHVHQLHLLLALPTAVALALCFLVTLRLIGARNVTERLLALVAVAVSATGAATHSVLATSMSDMVPCSLVLGAMLLLLRHAQAALDGSLPRGGRETLVHLLPGLLVGVALGLKLTFSNVTIGLVAAVLARSDLFPLLRLRMALLFCAGAVLGALAIGGWWWWRLWQFSGNPLFPLYNDVFRSPLAWPGDFVDRRFLPHDALHWLLYPLLWAARRAPLVTELDQPMRDPRIALALLATCLLLLRGLRRPAGARGIGRFAGVFFVVSFVLWEVQFSIFRYLSVLELLSATMLAMLAFELAPAEPARRAVLGGAVLLLVALRLTTVYPNWGRLPQPGGQPLSVQVPRLPDDALVLLLDPAPLSYLALFEPDRVRFLGTNNNLTQPWHGGAMQDRIRAAIAAQPVHLYGVEAPYFDKASEGADRALASYGLHRAGCEAVTGNIIAVPTRLCTLTR